MKQSIGVELDDLFEEPRNLHADLMGCRVRQAMENVAQEIAPSRTVQARDPELDLIAEEYVDEKALPVDWCLLRPFACSFLCLLRGWEETGAEEYRDAVKEGARVLLLAWATAIEYALRLDRLSEQPFVKSDEDAPHDVITALRELALEGRVLDTGERQRGQIVWAASNIFQESGEWDA